MRAIQGRERRIGVRRRRRKGMLVALLLSIFGITYWKVSRQGNEAVHLEEISSEAGNARFIMESRNKSSSKQSGLFSNTVAMGTNELGIKENVHLLSVASFAINRNKTLPSSSPKSSQDKLSLRENTLPNSTVELKTQFNKGGESKDSKRNISNANDLSRGKLSDRLHLRSEEGIQGEGKKQVGDRQEDDSLKIGHAKTNLTDFLRSFNRFHGGVPGIDGLKQSVSFVREGNRTKIQKSSENKSQDTLLLETNSKELIKLSMISEGYKNNYTRPRYTFSPEGQFHLERFVTDLANLSNGNSFENSRFNWRDKVRLILLSKGGIREIYSIADHPRLRLVAFDTPTLLSDIVPIESCPACGTIKSPDDINEILAFHVDRVLGINRALPVVAREFQEIELENLDLKEDLEDYEDKITPVMWFAKNLSHGGKFQKDQNSFQLNWRQYQEILSECHKKPNLTSAINCTEIDYSEWSRMAVFDFIMQNHDRLDRYCCGYGDIDEGEKCFRNEVREEILGCDDIDHRYLVHILTAESNPHQLVLLDNAGNLHRSKDHLNYEILKGIKLIPKTVLEKIFSVELEERLLESLKWDSVYWKSLGEESIKQLVHTIIERVDMLKTYFRTSGIAAV